MQNQFPLLDQIVVDVLEVSELGGRFHINDSGVYLAANEVQVCQFEIR